MGLLPGEFCFPTGWPGNVNAVTVPVKFRQPLLNHEVLVGVPLCVLSAIRDVGGIRLDRLCGLCRRREYWCGKRCREDECEGTSE
jgi:hypothetical protein